MYVCLHAFLDQLYYLLLLPKHLIPTEFVSLDEHYREPGRALMHFEVLFVYAGSQGPI